jgi:hypothetical protein
LCSPKPPWRRSRTRGEKLQVSGALADPSRRTPDQRGASRRGKSAGDASPPASRSVSYSAWEAWSQIQEAERAAELESLYKAHANEVAQLEAQVARQKAELRLLRKSQKDASLGTAVTPQKIAVSSDRSEEM